MEKRSQKREDVKTLVIKAGCNLGRRDKQELLEERIRWKLRRGERDEEL